MSEDQVTRALEVGRRAWPGLEIAEPRARAFLAARLEAGGDLALSDLYLACACVERMPGALEAFEAHCIPAVAGALSRLGARGLIDEVGQMLRTQLFVGPEGTGLIATYSGRGSLRSWLRVIAVREALRLMRRDRTRVPIGDDVLFEALTPLEGEDPEAIYLKQHYRDQMRQAFLKAVARLERRERIALRMNVLDGLSIDEIGAAVRVSRATAARLLTRARTTLIEGTRSALASELGLTASEVDSVIRLVGSSLDLSLETALKSRG